MFSLIQSFGRANFQLAAMGAGLGILIVGGASMVKISDQMAHAEGDLKSAIDARNAASFQTPTPDPAVLKEVAKATKEHADALRRLAEVEAGMPTKHAATTLELMHLQDAQKKAADTAIALAAAQAKVGEETRATYVYTAGLKVEIDSFVKKNAGYISSLADVTTGYASLVREGVPVKDLTRDMQIAVNISAAENISLSEAVGKLQSAEAGRGVGLKKLVGITLETIPATATLAEKEAILERNMVKVNAAFDGATAAVPKVTQNSNKLSIIWQELADKDGPNLTKGITDMEDSIIAGLPTWLSWLDKIGAVSDALTTASDKAARFLHDQIANDVKDSNSPDWGRTQLDRFGRWANQGHEGRASGGLVLPGSIYTVGERGPETLVLGASGGTVIPNRGGSGGGDLIVNGPFVHAETNADAHDIAVDAAWELRKMRRNY